MLLTETSNPSNSFNKYSAAICTSFLNPINSIESRSFIEFPIPIILLGKETMFNDQNYGNHVINKLICRRGYRQHKY